VRVRDASRARREPGIDVALGDFDAAGSLETIRGQSPNARRDPSVTSP
jgi:hypothetical protein